MNDTVISAIPAAYAALEYKTKSIGFSMSSDKHVGALLRTLAASKPGGYFLELGTGTGLSLAWILEGMDEQSKVITVDNDPELIQIATEALGADKRVQFICEDGEQWIHNYQSAGFDFIFADAWPGKYSVIEKTLDMLNPGGLYIIDDMLEQPNWPEGHQEKAEKLIDYLEGREDLRLTKMNWSTGLIIATKIKV
ncbi:O-methyltransferase [Catalinimonas niigatensis]|uniref:O-methyltransferase n=1 Tax=Catalinimonas niigatensis TaxID=1397264 RepID=UPI0026662597|nr:class I SAM-dependent methyltransferase [Catalinimonas niigatensis]WPP51125.1 methyltransferase domain-containing protein [Catalinimonas niigatensis]